MAASTAVPSGRSAASPAQCGTNLGFRPGFGRQHRLIQCVHHVSGAAGAPSRQPRRGLIRPASRRGCSRCAGRESLFNSRSNHRDHLLETLTRFPRRLLVGTHRHQTVRPARTKAARLEHPTRLVDAGQPLPHLRRGSRARLAGRPHLARQGRRPRADVVCGGPARRQPGADRPDEPGPQAPHVRSAGAHGLQGDRGRFPVGQPDRFRLRPRNHHRGRDSRRRHHPGADAVQAGVDRADIRGV